jgi:hypothetical protein
MLLDLEKSVTKTPSAKAEGGRARREETDDLKSDIFEDPNAAAEKNWAVFSRKFEAQKNQIIDELTLVVRRESDRVVRELKGSAHERIRDRVRLFCVPFCLSYDRDIYSTVNPRDLGRNGRYDTAFPPLKVRN